MLVWTQISTGRIKLFNKDWQKEKNVKISQLQSTSKGAYILIRMFCSGTGTTKLDTPET
jgi:hypothetical protein